MNLLITGENTLLLSLLKSLISLSWENEIRLPLILFVLLLLDEEPLSFIDFLFELLSILYFILNNFLFKK